MVEVAWLLGGGRKLELKKKKESAFRGEEKDCAESEGGEDEDEENFKVRSVSFGSYNKK